MNTVCAVVGILVLPVTVSLFLLVPTRYFGPTAVGLVIKRSGCPNPNRSETPSPTSQLMKEVDHD